MSNARLLGDIISSSGAIQPLSYNEGFVSVTSTSNSVTANCEVGNSFSHTLSENTTLTISNPPASGIAYAFTLEIIQDVSGSGYTFTFPPSAKFVGGTAPTLSTSANAIDTIVAYTRDGGTSWLVFIAGQALATPV